MSAILSPANRTTIVILLLVALLSVGVMASMGPSHIAVQHNTVLLMKADFLQVTLGALAVIASGAAIVGLTVAAPPVGLAVAAGFVGAWATGVGGALTVWDGLGRPSRH
ncbi:MAG TPA: hypothetical protein VGK74_03290 [Symbiobacteriaceae bacterium]|jgi:hypothetical protein